MHDSLGYVQHDPMYRPYHHNDMTFSMVYALTRRTSCCRSATTRSCTARARCCARCRATAGSSSPTCAPTSPSCGRTPASSCCSWARSSGRSRSGPRPASSTGGCSTTPDHRGRRTARRRPQPGLPRRPRRCGRATTTRPGSSGSTPTTPAWQRVLVPALGHRRHPTWPASRTSPAVPHEGYRLGLPSAGEWREVLNTDAEVYGGSGVGNLGGVTATEGDHLAAGVRRHVVPPPARSGSARVPSSSTDQPTPPTGRSLLRPWRDGDIDEAIAGHDDEIAHWFGPDVVTPTRSGARGGGRTLADRC